ncbi:Lrp/AsnC family transcriptional regulator [Deinococcus yavapaiensis]|uniref:AsnC-like helix-turn-helix protein n=1 Tax=Deinococcus yavapaiensis KR-236 TaxID=694435 RepID=A0A318S391_9DEIO|nr:Lrp/AsnC ligand binding domain-containing protein [Deinococcus yavapaiensis]PYE51895.1 AsnC-like helix-turn-helix protein [Deinococcus yavapaiensis KR-236]
MVTAIVLVNAERSRIPETAQELANATHVKEVYSVTGDWDIVAVLRLPSYDDLDDVVTGQLRRIEGITRTKTMLAFRTYSQDLLDQGFGVGIVEE